MSNRVRGHWDDQLEDGPLKEPKTVVNGHLVYRKESCTMDHRPVAARKYFGLWQCSACFGIIAPSLRRLRMIRLRELKVEDVLHTNGNGNGKHREAA